LPPEILVPGHNASQEAKCFALLKRDRSGPTSAITLQCRVGLDAIDAGEIDTAHPQQGRAQIELRGIARTSSFSLGLRWRFMHEQALELALQLSITFFQRTVIGIVEADGLLERKQVLFAPVALERLDDVGFARTNALMAQLGQLPRVTLAGDDRAHDRLAALTGEVGDDIAQLHVHLGQCLLHVLDVLRLIADQHVTLAREHPQDTNLVLRPKRPREQPEAHQLLQPLTVEHVGLAPRHVLHMPGIDQIDAEAPALQQFIERDPIDAGGFHRHRIYRAGSQPLGQRFQILGEALELANRAFVPVRRYCHKMAGRANVNARRVRVCQLETSLASSHRILHHQLRNAAPVWVRRCTHSLKRDVRCYGLTNVADVTQDQANQRASYAPLGLRSSPTRYSNLPQAAPPRCFSPTPARIQGGLVS
jgi:hypothetical protein